MAHIDDCEQLRSTIINMMHKICTRKRPYSRAVIDWQKMRCTQIQTLSEIYGLGCSAFTNDLINELTEHMATCEICQDYINSPTP